DYAIKDAVDVNNDGYADLIVQQQSTGTTYYAQEGVNGFVQWGTVINGPSAQINGDHQVVGNNVGLPRTSALVSDYNGDGTGDVLFQNDQTGQLTFTSMLAGTFQYFGAATGGLANLVFGGHGDINLDGFADVVVQDPTSGGIY